MFFHLIIMTLPILLSVAFLTLAERSLMASIQRRFGPNVTGINGLLQPFADGLKLAVKEPILPELSLSGAFNVAPIISLVLSQISYANILSSDSSFQGLILMAISSLSVYGVLLAGWSSNSKYAFLGSLRSVSLMISYELGFGAVLLSLSLDIIDHTGMKSLNFNHIINGFIFSHFPLLLLFLICILAETKRVPFDLPEAESELVAGYNVEFSSLAFALFFISEYANMAVMSFLACIYFLSTDLELNFFYLSLKFFFIFFFYVWIRGTLPRYRYDQFLRLGWKYLLPISLCLYTINAFFDHYF